MLEINLSLTTSLSIPLLLRISTISSFSLFKLSFSIIFTLQFSSIVLNIFSSPSIIFIETHLVNFLLFCVSNLEILLSKTSIQLSIYGRYCIFFGFGIISPTTNFLNFLH